MSDSQSHIIIDNGSYNIKCGFSSDETPKSIISNVISKSSNIVGEEHLDDLIWPVEHGLITHWDEMEKVWEHTFLKELHTSPEQRQVLISEAPLAPRSSREKIAQIMFEKFNVQAIFTSLQPLLSLYSVGKTTSIIFDSGDDSTSTVPIIDGFPCYYGVIKRDFGGRAFTEFLMRLLFGYSSSINNSSYENRKLAAEIKEKEGALGLKDGDMVISKESIYKLPDGKELNIGTKAIECAEAIFQPELMNKEVPGVHFQIFDSIMKCEIAVRKELYSNIVLSGGNTLFLNYSQRLNIEMRKISAGSLWDKIKIIAPSERKYSTWLGGVILAGLSSTQYIWVTRGEYQDVGPQVVHRKI